MSTYLLMRNFIALLHSLGYPRAVSYENFRSPNFGLMADIVRFLVSLFDADFELPSSIETEADRVLFVQSSGQLMVSQAHLDVNMRKLYQSDVGAVQEMSKFASLLHKSYQLMQKQTNIENGQGEETIRKMIGIQDGDELDQAVDRHMFDSFKTNNITSEILVLGTQLFDLLADEEGARQTRQEILSKPLVIEQAETSIRQSIKALQQELNKLQETKATLDQDSEDLNSKIEKKAAEVNRNRKKQEQLYSQRPAFIEELDKVETDIVQAYETYVLNSRCLFYLEQKLEELEEAEKMKIEKRNEEIKQMLEQMRMDEFSKEGGQMMVNEEGNDATGRMVMMDEDEADEEIPNYDGDGSGEDELSDDIVADINTKLDSKKMNNEARMLMTNTVTVAQRNMARSSKTARLYTYGSLADEEQDKVQARLSSVPKTKGRRGRRKSSIMLGEELARISDGSAKSVDSDMELDAMDDDEEDDDDEEYDIDNDVEEEISRADGGRQNHITSSKLQTNQAKPIGNSDRNNSEDDF